MKERNMHERKQLAEIKGFGLLLDTPDESSEAICMGLLKLAQHLEERLGHEQFALQVIGVLQAFPTCEAAYDVVADHGLDAASRFSMDDAARRQGSLDARASREPRGLAFYTERTEHLASYSSAYNMTAASRGLDWRSCSRSGLPVQVENRYADSPSEDESWLSQVQDDEADQLEVQRRIDCARSVR
jgi:hypothetical protein